jgi:hypothetical protein
VGFPLWYRWPYEEIEPFASPGLMSNGSRAITWQRQWGGGRVKHGPERLMFMGQTATLTTYQNGRKHGPKANYSFVETVSKDGRISFVRSKEPFLAGNYVDDEKDGDWTSTVNGPMETTTYRNGKQVSP